MKVFVDTNVVLEHILRREKFLLVEKILLFLDKSKSAMLISSGSFYSMLYLIEKYLKKSFGLSGEAKTSALRVIMESILSKYSVAEHDSKSLLIGINNLKFNDLEDSCQYQLAQKSSCTHLLTFNTSDYPNDDDVAIEVLSPEDFIDTYITK